MGTEVTMNLMKETISLLLALSLPLLLVGLIVGLAISLIQAATQVQEASLVFVPKLLAVGATMYFIAPWSSEKLVNFLQMVFQQITMTGAGGIGV